MMTCPTCGAYPVSQCGATTETKDGRVWRCLKAARHIGVHQFTGEPLWTLAARREAPSRLTPRPYLERCPVIERVTGPLWTGDVQCRMIAGHPGIHEFRVNEVPAPDPVDTRPVPSWSVQEKARPQETPEGTAATVAWDAEERRMVPPATARPQATTWDGTDRRTNRTPAPWGDIERRQRLPASVTLARCGWEENATGVWHRCLLPKGHIEAHRTLAAPCGWREWTPKAGHRVCILTEGHVGLHQFVDAPGELAPPAPVHIEDYTEMIPLLQGPDRGPWCRWQEMTPSGGHRRCLRPEGHPGLHQFAAPTRQPTPEEMREAQPGQIKDY